MRVEKVFCNFCGDHMGETIHRCEDCGAYMCEQAGPNGSGCIAAGSFKNDRTFRCVICDSKAWRKSDQPPTGEQGCPPASSLCRCRVRQR